jgi:hypothetical protein
VGLTNPVSALFCGSPCRPQQIEVTDTKRDRYFVHGDDRGIAAAALKTADILLAEAPLSSSLRASIRRSDGGSALQPHLV